MEPLSDAASVSKCFIYVVLDLAGSSVGYDIRENEKLGINEQTSLSNSRGKSRFARALQISSAAYK